MQGKGSAGLRFRGSWTYQGFRNFHVTMPRSRPQLPVNPEKSSWAHAEEFDSLEFAGWEFVRIRRVGGALGGLGSWAWIGFRGVKRSTGWGLKVRAIQGLYKLSLEAMLWQGRPQDTPPAIQVPISHKPFAVSNRP